MPDSRGAPFASPEFLVDKPADDVRTHDWTSRWTYLEEARHGSPLSRSRILAGFDELDGCLKRCKSKSQRHGEQLACCIVFHS